ncbi:MAG: D-2-hydroxyacid dehydrogenase [Clostridia bacterium]|nr:D-2-hydroxyacid dehydrogenase [Clostridia bacterium]
MKILVTDSLSLKSHNDLSLHALMQFGEVSEFEGISREELMREVKDKDIILTNKVVIDREVMENAPRLRYIGLFATGYNNIDITAAKEKGIVVANAGGYSTNAVAQQVIAYILAHFTKISAYDEFVKQGGWLKSKCFAPLVFATDEVCDKTLGIVGYGSIGQAVEKIAVALGMRVLVYTRTPRDDEKFVDFDTLLKQSDIISMHCPLNEQTKDLMNREAFAKCKDGAFFINTARGGVVDEFALFDALKSGKLSGAAVDVLKSEPMSEECPLINAPNIIITPHTAWAPLKTRQRLLGIVCDNIQAFLNGNPKNNVAR